MVTDRTNRQSKEGLGTRSKEGIGTRWSEAGQAIYGSKQGIGKYDML